jgi:hypothetical protein
MNWEVVPLAHGLGPYRAVWDTLNASLYGSHPFFDSAFIEPMLNCFATGSEHLCLHNRGGVIDGMLIVIPQRHGKWSLFVPAQAQIAPLFLSAPEDLRSLIKQLPGLTLALELSHQDPLYTPFSLPLNDPMPLVATDHARTISVRLEGTFEDYWEARSKNLRKNLKRYSHRVQDAGMTPRLVYLAESAAMPEAVNRYGELESRGWKGRSGTAIHASNIQGKFYRAILRSFATSGRAVVYELYFDDILVASRLCIVGQEMLVILKKSYHEGYARYAPGRLLLHALLQHEFELRRVATIEFYTNTNANTDQLSWSTHQRHIYHIMLFKNRAVQKAVEWSHRVRKLVGPLTHAAKIFGNLWFITCMESLYSGLWF